jgi:lipoprotein signal peptidase
VSPDETLGTLFVGSVLALLAWALLRMRPLWPYLCAATALLLLDAGLRAISALAFPEYGSGPFVHCWNPAARTSEDLSWPNWIAMGALTAMAAWLAFRPARRSVAVGVGLALIVPSGWLNLVEPLLRGGTTDYLMAGDWVWNLADVALLAGIGVLLGGLAHWELLGGRRRARERERAEGEG